MKRSWTLLILGLAALAIMLAFGLNAEGPCIDQKDIVCGAECKSVAGVKECRTTSPESTACIEFAGGNGCASATNSPCCR